MEVMICPAVRPFFEGWAATQWSSSDAPAAPAGGLLLNFFYRGSEKSHTRILDPSLEGILDAFFYRYEATPCFRRDFLQHVGLFGISSIGILRDHMLRPRPPLHSGSPHKVIQAETHRG